MGRTFAEAERMIDGYRHGSNRVGCALVRASVDWRRIGAGDPADRDLVELLAAELSGEVVTRQEFEGGLGWATREVAGGQRFLASIAGGDRVRYRAHSYLIAADEDYGLDGEIRAVPTDVYEVALRTRRLAPRDLLAIATDAGSRHQLEVAQHLLDAIIARLVEQDDAATLAGAYFYRGRLRAGRGYEEEAEADYTAAIELEGAEPDYRARSYNSRGILRTAEGRMEEAEADYTMAIEHEGAELATRAWVYYGRGNLRTADGRMDEAEADYTMAIEHEGAEPSIRAQAYVNRGNRRGGDGRLDQAEADYTAALDLEGADREARCNAYLNRGRLRKEDGRAEEGEAGLEAAIDIRASAAPNALRALADLLRRMGRTQDEVALYQSAAASGRAELVAIAMPRLEAHARRIAKRYNPSAR